MTRNQAGFTIVEVMVALLVLTIGILGLASTAALTTRMIGQGERYSEVSARANERLEMLRAQPCSLMTAGSQTATPYTLTWTVDSIGGRPPGRRVQVIVASPTGPAEFRVDTFTSNFACEI